MSLHPIPIYVRLRVSVTVNLRQAIAASDERQILVCLSNVDSKTISATAKELTGQEATALLERLDKMISTDARKLLVVVEWTRELVLAHASFIASQAGAKSRLKPILDALNNRLNQQDELVRLKQVTEALIRTLSGTSDGINTPVNSAMDTSATEPFLRWSPSDE